MMSVIEPEPTEIAKTTTSSERPAVRAILTGFCPEEYTPLENRRRAV